MEGIVVKDVIEAVRIARRLAKVFSTAGAQRLVDELDVRKSYPQQAGEVGQAEERGFKDGLNAGCRVSSFEVDLLDVDDIIDAVYGNETESSSC